MLELNTASEGSLASPRWRNFWGLDTNANKSLCAPADQVRDDESEFRKMIAKRIATGEESLLSGADAESLKVLLSNCLLDAENQQEKHQSSQRKTRRLGQKAVLFLNNFSNFMQAYSGVVEIMKAADQQYGGVAYSVLSLFLIVAVNKQRKEERIDSKLLDLQREFARIGILQDIYSSDAMKARIVEAYRLGIEFVREATLYYSRSTYRRIIEAITKPPQLSIEIKVSEINLAMAEIEKESCTLNSKRLHEVQQRVDEVKHDVSEVQRDVSNIKDDVEASHLHQEKALLTVLKNELLPHDYDPFSILSSYSSAVEQSFKNPGRVSVLNFDQLKRRTAFKEWEESLGSCMMLLHGRTEITKVDYSWLSPATFHLIEYYRYRGHAVIFHCCHERLFMEADTSAHVVLSSLVYQLLAIKSSILRDRPHFEHLKRKISDPSWRASSPKVAFGVLAELLSTFSEDVYILLDRVDRIKGDPDRFIDPMVNLVKS